MYFSLYHVSLSITRKFHVKKFWSCKTSQQVLTDINTKRIQVENLSRNTARRARMAVEMTSRRGCGFETKVRFSIRLSYKFQGIRLVLNNSEVYIYLLCNVCHSKAEFVLESEEVKPTRSYFVLKCFFFLIYDAFVLPTCVWNWSLWVKIVVVCEDSEFEGHCSDNQSALVD